jgi:hypothetical protein
MRRSDRAAARSLSSRQESTLSEWPLIHISFLHWCSAKRTIRLLFKKIVFAGDWKTIVRASKDLKSWLRTGMASREDLYSDASVIARASLVGCSAEHKRNRRRNDGVYE